MNLTPKQRKVVKILKAGGLMYMYLKPRRKHTYYRVLDSNYSPVLTINYRTFSCLRRKECIAKHSEKSYFIINNNIYKTN